MLSKFRRLGLETDYNYDCFLQDEPESPPPAEEPEVLRVVSRVVYGHMMLLWWLTSIMDNSSHPLHYTVESMSISFSARQLHSQCKQECPLQVIPA